MDTPDPSTSVPDRVVPLNQWFYGALAYVTKKHEFLKDPQQASKWQEALKPGLVYPTVYMTKEQFEQLNISFDYQLFVVIRDLRDTLVSAYFSFRYSHPDDPGINEWRALLSELPMEDGLIRLLDGIQMCADIQVSWRQSNVPYVKYEDLLLRDEEILEDILLNKCKLPVDSNRLRAIIVANRFENVTRGRKRGEEDITAHERKGIAGDWKNYFTEKVKDAFKQRYGQVLIDTGYEKDMNW